MKQFLFSIGLLPLLATAQNADQPGAVNHYIFSQFTEGKVFFKGGGTNASKLNYNALTNEMCFDNKGQILAMANPENIDSVVINDRVFIFIPAENKFYERLTLTPHPFYREYSCYVEQPGANTGYGMKSNTTAATYIRGIYGPNTAYQTKLPEALTITAKQIWWIKTDKGLQQFTTEQQLKKIFPDKKDVISDWTKKNKTRFSKQEDVVSLVQQIDQ